MAFAAITAIAAIFVGVEIVPAEFIDPTDSRIIAVFILSLFSNFIGDIIMFGAIRQALVKLCVVQALEQTAV